MRKRAIVAYILNEPNAAGGLGALLGASKRPRPTLLRAEADLRIGPDLIVVPDEAVVRSEDPGYFLSPMEEATPEASP